MYLDAQNHNLNLLRQQQIARENNDARRQVEQAKAQSRAQIIRNQIEDDRVRRRMGRLSYKDSLDQQKRMEESL